MGQQDVTSYIFLSVVAQDLNIVICAKLPRVVLLLNIGEYCWITDYYKRRKIILISRKVTCK